MAEVRAPTRPKLVWVGVKDFFATHTISTTGGLLLLLLALFLLWPIVEVLVKSVVGSEGFTLEYYKDFAAHAYYHQSIYYTMFLGLIVTPVCLGISFCIAYLTTRGPVHLRTPMKLIALSPLVAPPYMFALSVIILFGHNGFITRALNLSWSIYGFWGCVLVQIAAYIPLAYLMIENSLISLNPNLEDSAANLGATEGQILRNITIPLLRPGFLKAALLVFVLAISDFGSIALLCGRIPFLAPVAYTMITGEADFNMASVLSVFLILPCLLIFIVQNYLIKGKGYATVTGKPVAAEPKHINKSILIPMLAVSFIACGFIVLTFGVVGMGAFTNIVGVDNTFTLNKILDRGSVLPLINSFKVSSLAGLFGALLGVVMAYVIVRGKFIGRAALEPLCLVGFVLPGTILGIGYVLAFNNPPLLITGTLTILVLNNAFRFLAVGEEAGITKIQQLSIEVEEASLNLGASTVTTFRRIVLPIIFPAFMYGFIYVFMRTMVGLSAMIFLITPRTDLAAVYVFIKAKDGFMGLACATTVKLVVVDCICVAVIQYLSKWTGLSVTRKA